jgi:dTDP-4-amino-4,6-dideoxygalactose transaminase
LLGISQLKKIKKFINKRILLSSKYKKELILKTNLVKSLELENSNLSAWHLFIILIDFKKLRINKNDFIGSMLKHKIVLQQHYIPIYRLLNLKNKKQISFPNADKYFKNALSLPLFNDLTFSKQKYIITKIIKLINYAAIKKRTK